MRPGSIAERLTNEDNIYYKNRVVYILPRGFDNEKTERIVRVAPRATRVNRGAIDS